MTDLLQIFTGNPLTTFVGKKIEAATRPELDAEDWALNMEICDIINENDEDAKDAARAIKKRLLQIEQDRNFVVTNRTLTVLDTCVSNCSHRFHVLVMTKDFIQDLVKLIGPKNNPPIELQERVLSMIERWADAFRNQPDLSGVVSVCNDLKAKGVVFPPRDPSSRVPIQTPQRSVPPPQRQETRPFAQPAVQRSDSAGGPARVAPQQPGASLPAMAPQPSGQIVLEGEGYNKISQDLIVVQSSIEMFTDILKALESRANEEADWRLADELSVTCRQMKDRIVDLIERVANEDLTIEFLRLNDELNNIFTRYDRLVKDRSEALASGGQQQSDVARHQDGTQPEPTAGRQLAVSPQPRLPGVSSGTLNELSLIDFNASGSSDNADSHKRPQATTSAPTATAQSTTVVSSKSNPAKPTDPFDTSNIPLADSLSKLNLDAKSGAAASSKKKATGLPEEISSVREQDFAEIENWLATDSGRNLASLGGDAPSMEPISIPNSEFDNFIASRALAGSNTPSSQQAKEGTQRKPEPSV